MEQFITLKQAASLLHCSELSVRRMVKTRKLASRFIAGKYLIDIKDIEAFIQGGKSGRN